MHLTNGSFDLAFMSFITLLHHYPDSDSSIGFHFSKEHHSLLNNLTYFLGATMWGASNQFVVQDWKGRQENSRLDYTV